MGKRSESDEFYVIDLCDEILGASASRQHRFDWLRGDWSERKQSFSHLPVDAYWPSLHLVVEYAERQHSESVKVFDQRDTVSGVPRGQQRRIYDQRRVDLVPVNDLTLIVVPAVAFSLKRMKIVRHPERDIEVLQNILADFIVSQSEVAVGSPLATSKQPAGDEV